MRRRTHLLRDLTSRSCLSVALQARSKFCGPNLRSSTAGCPEQRGGTRVEGSILLLPFLGNARKGSRLPRDKRLAIFQVEAKAKSALTLIPQAQGAMQLALQEE